MAPPLRKINTKLQWFPYTFWTPSAKHQNVIWLGWVFQTWCPANVSSVGKLTAAFIAIINFGRQESHLQGAQYEPRSHAQNQQSPVTFGSCSASLHTDYRTPPPFLIWWATIDFEHRHQSNSIFVYLFKHVGTGQSNDASPKIGSPNRGKSW